jgi:hypothetical protein
MNERQFSIPALLAFAALACFGCSDPDDVGTESAFVGGACQDNRDCEGTCLRGGDFPEGTCSIDCRDDGDCPAGTACIDREGGTCLLLCDRHSDCRGGYECDDQERHGHVGDEHVCIN